MMMGATYLGQFFGTQPLTRLKNRECADWMITMIIAALQCELANFGARLETGEQLALAHLMKTYLNST